MTFNCAFSTDKCCGAGEVHKYCSQQVQDRKEALEAEKKRMECGKCDKCKVEGVKLYPVQGHILDLCAKCVAPATKARKYIRGEK